MSVDPRQRYAGCIASFVEHGYDQCLQQALSHLGRLPSLEIHQFIIICMQRLGQSDLVELMGDRAISDWEGHTWEQALLRLTLGRAQRADVMDSAKSAFQRCQAYYYAGAHSLTSTRNEMAIQEFHAAAALNVDCLESDLARAELTRLMPPGTRSFEDNHVLQKFGGGYGERIDVILATPKETSAGAAAAPERQRPDEAWKEPSPVTWGRARVFISSTFKDMQRERDLLVKQIFPELRKLCSERHMDLVEVDLRWGISDERKGEILDICLAEIDDCDYFVGLLGERYGWVPDAIPPELVSQRPWLAAYPGRSVTELEVRHALLNHPGLAKRSFFYFRSPAFTQRGAEPSSPPLDTLKEDIRKSAARLPLDSYADPETAARQIRNDLWGAIQDDNPPELCQDPLLREHSGHAVFAEGHLRGHLPRQPYIDQLDEHIRASNQPLVVTGEPGSGKSALLAYWARRFRSQNPDDFVLEHYIGATSGSSNYKSILRRVMGEIRRRYQPPPEHREHYEVREDEDDVGKLLGAFHNHLFLVAAGRPKKRFVLVLDGCDQLEDVDDAQNLGWLPETFVSGTHLIMSARAGKAFDVASRRGWSSLRVEPFKPVEVERGTADYLKKYAKALNLEQRRRIARARQTASPLFLKTLLNELRVFGRHEELDQRITHYLEAPGLPGLYSKVLDRLEQDYDPDQRGVVRDTLSFLYSARAGLTETEILELLGGRDEPLPRALWSPLFLALQDEIVNRSGLLNYLHSDFRLAVRSRFLPDDSKRGEYHLRLADHFEGQPVSDRKAHELPWHLRQGGQWERLKNVLTDLDLFERLFLAGRADDLQDYWRSLQGAYDVVEAYDTALLNAERSGVPDERLGVHLLHVAILYEGFRRLEDAERLFRRCIELGIRLLGEGHPSVATVRQRLGRFLVLKGNRNEGGQLLEQALRSKESILGPMHPTIASSLLDLSELFEANGDLERAEQYCQRALEIRETVNGFVHLATAACLAQTALLALKKRDLDRAEQACEQVQKIDEMLGLKDHPTTFKIQDILAEVYRMKKQYPRAESLQRRILERRIRTLGLENPASAMTLGRIGLLRLLQRDIEGGAPLCRQALEISSKTAGAQHPCTIELRKIVDILPK